MRYTSTSLALLILLLTDLLYSAAQSSPTALVEIHFKGTPPPVPSLYTCRSELEGKSYIRGAARNCLDQILASGYFQSGDLVEETLPSGRILIVLDLAAPSLRVVTLDMNPSPEEQRQIRNWLEKDPRTLQPGSEFNNASLGLTVDGIVKYYESLGQKVGVSSVTRLEYKEKSAIVDISIARGPSIPKVSLQPPYGPGCIDSITSLNWLDIDDLALSPLAHRLTEVQPFSCFDERSLKQDQERLQKTGAFESVAYTIGGAKSNRQVSLKLRGKPIIVSSIRLKCYGNASGCEHSVRDLPLRAGTAYTRSAAHETEKDLKQAFSKPGQTVEVVEDAEINPDGTATIQFSILSYDKDRFFVDGREIVSTASN